MKLEASRSQRIGVEAAPGLAWLSLCVHQDELHYRTRESHQRTKGLKR
jgi:hypothetical protein